MSDTPIDLRAKARQEMIDAGFHPDFTSEALRSAQNFKQNPPSLATGGIRDLRALLWSSIDNDASRDLDQVEYVEPLADGAVRLLVGIADVDTAVGKGSAVDRRAGLEATSVYTGVATFPMLPEELSTNRTSLLDAQDRVAMVIDLRVLPSGEAGEQAVYP